MNNGHKCPPGMYDRVKRLISAGLSTAEISRTVGKTVATLKRYAELGLIPELPERQIASIPPHIAAEWEESTPIQDAKRDTDSQWVCRTTFGESKNCGFSWLAPLSARLKGGRNCPECARTASRRGHFLLYSEEAVRQSRIERRTYKLRT
jgi:hypothetical protein